MSPPRVKLPSETETKIRSALASIDREISALPSGSESAAPASLRTSLADLVEQLGLDSSPARPTKKWPIAIAIGCILALVVLLAAVKGKQIASLINMGKSMEKAGPPPEVVGTTVAHEDAWEDTLSAVGSVAAVRGVTVSSEAAGVITAIRFESGQIVKAGQVLVELDTNVERAQLASLQARKSLASLTVERSRKLRETDGVVQAQLDTDEAALKSSDADVRALFAQIARKIVRAPFAGRVGIRSVNLGQFLTPGAPVTLLESLDSVFVDFTLPQQALRVVKVGSAVRVRLSDATGNELRGTVTAIDPTVDLATRAVKLRSSVTNDQDRLRPGMFVNVTLMLGDRDRVVLAPVTAIVHASYGDSVFVLEAPIGPDPKTPRVARQQFVKLGDTRGDFVAISEGIRTGEEVVTAGAFKLRNGGRVVVNNEIKPSPSLSPTVENR